MSEKHYNKSETHENVMTESSGNRNAYCRQKGERGAEDHLQNPGTSVEADTVSAFNGKPEDQAEGVHNKEKGNMKRSVTCLGAAPVQGENQSCSRNGEEPAAKEKENF